MPNKTTPQESSTLALAALVVKLCGKIADQLPKAAAFDCQSYGALDGYFNRSSRHSIAINDQVLFMVTIQLQ